MRKLQVGAKVVCNGDPCYCARMEMAGSRIFCILASPEGIDAGEVGLKDYSGTLFLLYLDEFEHGCQSRPEQNYIVEEL